MNFIKKYTEFLLEKKKEKESFEDKIEGVFEFAKAYFNFHPNIKIFFDGKRNLKISLPGHKEDINLKVLKGLPKIDSSIFSPEFGLRIPNQRLIIEFNKSNVIALEVKWNKSA